MEHIMLNLSEAFFAFFGKYFWHFLSHSRLYVPVEVVEWHTELFGKHLSYGGLSSSHVAYEDYSLHCLVVWFLL